MTKKNTTTRIKLFETGTEFGNRQWQTKDLSCGLGNFKLVCY